MAALADHLKLAHSQVMGLEACAQTIGVNKQKWLHTCLMLEAITSHTHMTHFYRSLGHASMELQNAIKVRLSETHADA